MKYLRRCSGLVVCSTLLSPFNTFAENDSADENKRPNIILIYVDDLAYSDVGCYGRAYGNDFIETPNIDKLATEGVRFTSAYSAAPISSASRAGLLTGQYPARLGFEFVTSYEKNAVSWDSDEWKKKYTGKKLLPPPLTLHLPLDVTTMAEMFKTSGYHTGIAGKWHVSAHEKRYKDWSTYYGPTKRGFQWTADTYGSHPYSYSSNKPEKITQSLYPEDELTNRAIDFIRQEHTSPFFLYVSHYFVHTPIDVRSDKLIEKYREKADGKYNEERVKYAAFVETLDHYVGLLLAALEEQDYANNTIVIFTSDNGGDPRFSFTRPFRGSKWNLYEGGVRVPFIMKWPSKIKPDTTCDLPILQIDLMPTFMEISGKTEQNNILDGLSILDLLKNKNTEKYKSRSMIWHFPYYHPEGEAYNSAEEKISLEDGYISKTKPQSSIRKGDYKLIYFYEDGKSELYNLKNDPGETSDLTIKKDNLSKKLKKELLQSLSDMNARIPRQRD